MMLGLLLCDADSILFVLIQADRDKPGLIWDFIMRGILVFI